MEGIQDQMTLGDLAGKMKRELPYVFRYKLEDCDGESIDLKGVPRTPDRLLRAMVDHLGKGWRGAILSYGLVLYRNTKNYPFGEEIDPAL